MCMIYNEDYILVQDRQNLDWPGITFPGGNVESVKREVFEETGLIIENSILCGVKQFQTKQNQRYVVLFFKTNQFEGNLLGKFLNQCIVVLQFLAIVIYLF